MWSENDGVSVTGRDVTIDEHQINPGIENENENYPEESSKDPWADRAQGMVCATCVFYVEKKSSSKLSIEIGRCRCNAPTMNGYPVVYPTDWCGSHKLDEEKLLCG